MSHRSMVQRGLDRHRGELDVIRIRVHGDAERCDVGEYGREIEILERPSTKDLGRYLAGYGNHGCSVDPGVVETREEVGRAGPGDRETGGGPAGQLAVRRGCERRGAFVANSEVPELAPLLGAPKCIGESEVGVANHPEDGIDTPVHQGLDHGI